MSDSIHGGGHTDSIRSGEDGPKDPEKKKSRRPANTAFRQQRLKAWQPILTPKTVLPLFFTIGIIFAPIGGLLLYASSQVQEIRLEYSDCATKAPELLSSNMDNFGALPSDHVSYSFRSSNGTVNARWAVKRDVNVTINKGVTKKINECHLRFGIPNEIDAPILLYYQLTNFYQNHRRYVQSFDSDQLKGTAVSWGTINGGNCDPLRGDHLLEKPYYPCGLIANSMFNDTISSPIFLSAKNPVNYTMTNNSISWSSDKDLYGKTKYKYDEVLPPPNWKERYPQNYTEDNPPPDLESWEEFQVWMRTAALPTFSKLHLRNDNTKLKPGTYEIIIQDHFPVTEYKGTKSIILTTRSVIGGRNPFLGIAYIVVGGLCILLGGVFTVTHLIRPRKLGDHTYLSWNNIPNSKNAGSSTATTSGREMRPGEA